MNAILSKYVITAEVDNEIILFNTNGGALVTIDRKYINGRSLNKQMFTRDQLTQLSKMGIIGCNAEPDVNSMRDCDSITISVELLGACNFECKYCYQSEWSQRPEISYELLDMIASYLKKVISLKDGLRVIHLNFIGGEPLLAKERILYLYNTASQILSKTNIQLSVAIDTNGALLDEEFLSAFQDPLYLSITLSGKEDHNIMRPYKNGRGSYDVIIENLRKCSCIIRKKNIELAIRYNTHHGNIKDFRPFLKELRELDFPILTVNAMYAREVDGNVFENNLTYQDFVTWNSTVAIDAMVDNGIDIYYFPQTVFRLCKAYQHFCYKFFSDGSIGLCDATEYVPGMPNIKDYSNNPLMIEEVFKEYKAYNPLSDNDCRTCNRIFLCSGKYFCQQTPCEEQIYDDKLFITKFIEHSKKGNAKYFVRAFNKATSKHA